ncbi:MAG: alpha/beta hydrolase [Pseudoxanthomonas suwonensis]|nr:alpha/beta hydrolase [Pseudoxanthomonas suwonensis]
MSNPVFPDKSTTLLLPGPAGALELAVDLPDPEATGQPVVAVICHPLPTEGGTMHNKVVTMLARSLRELGVTTVRFNFRGTGRSEGSFDAGPGEVEDLRAVVAWVREQRPVDLLWLAGFSFGAWVSISAADALEPHVLISIAPPVGHEGRDFSDIRTPGMPWLVVMGDADEVVDSHAVYAWVEGLDRDVELVKMPETSHFFHRKLIDLRGAVKNGVRGWLPNA